MRDLLWQLDNTPADPTKAARQAMRAPLPKRFFKVAAAQPAESGYAVFLDGKPVRTPARRLLVLPTEEAANLIAEEFHAQQEHIDPAAMPVTRLANTTVDGVADDPIAVARDVVQFAGSDLLCYRADSPRELVRRQAEVWDPVLDWMRDIHGARFILCEGVMPVEQPREAVAAFAVRLKQHAEPFRIACIHTMTSLTGSAMLALAVAEKFRSPEEAWNIAHVDEDWNIEQWGRDRDAAARREMRHLEMMAAARMMVALG